MTRRVSIPLAGLILGSCVWASILAANVPDPMAIHWSGDGTANGFSSPASAILLLTGLSLGTLLVFAALTRSGFSTPRAARTNAAILGWTVALVMTLQVRIFVDQQGLTDAAAARISTSTIWWAAVLPVLIAVVLAVVAGRSVIDDDLTDEPVEIDQTTGKINAPENASVVWFRTETMGTWVQVFIVALTVGTAILCLASAVPVWSAALLVAIIVVACLGSCMWRIRVDSRGFSYRSLLGIPKALVPFDEISHAEPVTIRPGEWGGWGWRLNGSGTGLITKSGPGIRITRTNQHTIELNCDDARRGLAVLEHYGVDISS